MVEILFGGFVWNSDKETENVRKHGIDFATAAKAFSDLRRVVMDDLAHSTEERRFYCLGRVDNEIVTVRFTDRENRIRIFGAGYWRKGRRAYEEKNQIY